MGTWRKPRAIERSTLSTPFIFHRIISLSLSLSSYSPKLIIKTTSSLSLDDHHLLHIHTFFSFSLIFFFFLNPPRFFCSKRVNSILYLPQIEEIKVRPNFKEFASSQLIIHFTKALIYFHSLFSIFSLVL